MRANVVIKTHAATGQKSPAGNVLSAVWDTSSIDTMATSPSHHVDETDSVRKSAEGEKEVRGGMSSEQSRHHTPTQQVPGVTVQSADSASSFKRFRGTFMKKLSEG